MPIQYVGGFATGSTSASDYTVSLTSLTGGIASAPSTNDLVLVCHGWKSTTDGNPGIVTPTATSIADVYANGTNDANMDISWFFASSSTSLTSITVNSNGGTTGTKTTTVAVFRGVSLVNPIDVTTTVSTGSGSGDANPPAITPATTGAWIVCCALVATGGTIASAFTTPPSTFTLGRTGGVAGTDISYSGIAYKSNPTIGSSNDPGAFGGGAGGTNATWAAGSVVLRPATGQIKYWDGSAWTIDPVKYWNGSSWLIKPLKHWNGSAWVTTNY